MGLPGGQAAPSSPRHQKLGREAKNWEEKGKSKKRKEEQERKRKEKEKGEKNGKGLGLYPSILKKHFLGLHPK